MNVPPYYVVKKDAAALLDGYSWPSEYPFAVVSGVSAWRVALFADFNMALVCARGLNLRLHEDELNAEVDRTGSSILPLVTP